MTHPLPQPNNRRLPRSSTFYRSPPRLLSKYYLAIPKHNICFRRSFNRLGSDIDGDECDTTIKVCFRCPPSVSPKSNRLCQHCKTSKTSGSGQIVTTSSAGSGGDTEVTFWHCRARCHPSSMFNTRCHRCYSLATSKRDKDHESRASVSAHVGRSTPTRVGRVGVVTVLTRFLWCALRVRSVAYQP